MEFVQFAICFRITSLKINRREFQIKHLSYIYIYIYIYNNL